MDKDPRIEKALSLIGKRNTTTPGAGEIAFMLADFNLNPEKLMEMLLNITREGHDTGVRIIKQGSKAPRRP